MAIVPRWEWRTFGEDFGTAEPLLSTGNRGDVEESDEAYILSAASDASIKLRFERLDVKRLERVDADGLEQWRPVLKASLPLCADDAAVVKTALGVDLATSIDTLDELLATAGGVMVLGVHKRRVRHTFGGCMAEVTELATDHGSVRTLAVESTDAQRVVSAVRALGLEERPNVCVARGLKALVGLDGDRHAVIDIGTNSVKLHVAERRPDGGWETLADRAEVTRLGEGLHAHGQLGAQPIRRTVKTIATMAREASDRRARTVVAVGTAGLRMATNSGALLAAVRRRTGLVVDVLTGDDEARLAAQAAIAGLATEAGSVVIFDTGGGSTQFTFMTNGTLDERFSVDVGAVRLTRDLDLADAVSEARIDEAQRVITAELERLAGRPRPATIVGMGGAVTNLAAIFHGLRAYDPNRVHGTVLTVDEIDRQIELFRGRDAAARAKIPGLQPARAEVILAGACVVRAVVALLGDTTILVCDRGLRHGVLAERFAAHEPAIGHDTHRHASA